MLKYQAVKILTIERVFAQSDVGSYTQVRIAGDFLSSRKTARAERYTPKTTAAELVAEVVASFLITAMD